METAALCKPIQRFADLLRIPGTWVLTGLGQLLAALGSFPHFPQPLRLLHTHLYWRFLECQSIEVTLTQNGHLTHHEIPSVASLRPGGHFPRIGWPVSPEYAQGESLAGHLAKSTLFPSFVVQLVKAGETSGQLDRMFARIAQHCEVETETAISALLKLLEPIAILLVGGVVGGIVLSLYLPIFSLAGRLSHSY